MKKTGFKFKIIAVFLALNLLYEIFFPTIAFALTGGPSQPEVQSFEPIGTTDMVDLFSGDFVYNIPLMDVGGYPINISYHSGITMDQEASWVGLGWNINPGAINRNMRGLPDDFKGDKVSKSLSIRPSWTIGVKPGLNVEILGLDASGDFTKKLGDVGLPNLGIYYNNYKGLGYELSFGVELAKFGGGSLSLGIGFNSESGISLDPKLNFEYTATTESKDETKFGSDHLKVGLGLSYNSTAGLKGLSLSANCDAMQSKIGRQGIKEGNFNAGSTISFSAPTYSPEMSMSNLSFGFNFKFDMGFAFYTVHPNIKFDAYYNQQLQLEKTKTVPAYGYIYSDQANNDDDPLRVLLDFNREKDVPYIKHVSPNLPVTNYTYDLYNATGHGVSGLFRPHRNDVGVVYDNKVTSIDIPPIGLGIEIGAPALFHFGLNGELGFTYSSSGKWDDNNLLSPQFPSTYNIPGTIQEAVYFKQAGEKQPIIGSANLNEEAAVAMALNTPDNPSTNQLLTKFGSGRPASSLNYSSLGRVRRNAIMSYLTADEAKLFALDQKIKNYPLRTDNTYPQSLPTSLDRTIDIPAKGHHISEVTVTNPDGSRYVYGIPAYNNFEADKSFAMGCQGGGAMDCNHDCNSILRGMIHYNDGSDNTEDNDKGINHFYSGTITPSYAHSYLLTAVLSADYVDVTGDGITDDDLGSAIKLNYSRAYGKDNPYKWRVPLGKDSANYNEGYRSDPSDDKANYVYGEKEIWYLNSIESKNYIAEFTLSSRSDGYGVTGEDGTIDNQYNTGKRPMMKLDKIVLYSKTDRLNNGNGAVPIKSVLFKYDYYLCPGIPNNDNAGGTSNTGKLTLRKIYFTYGNSYKAELNPYTFHYFDETNPVPNPENPSYNLKGYDRWGNYKPTGWGNVWSTTALTATDLNTKNTTSEFPYVDQNKTNADAFSSAWSLSSIDLPSGGTIKVNYESDDYGYVQDRQANQMFKIIGSGNNYTDYSNWGAGKWDGTQLSYLYDDFINFGNEDPYIFFNLSQPISASSDAAAKGQMSAYVSNISDLYFKFYTDLTGNGDYEYVPGYTHIADYGAISTSSGTYAVGWIKLQEEQVTSGAQTININPVSLAAWDFGKSNLPKKIYPGSDLNGTNDNIISSLLGFLTNIESMIGGFYYTMHLQGNGRKFIPAKSFIRLNNPNKIKYGGGCRVKQLTINDSWAAMTAGSSSEKSFEYGQKYDYITTDPATGRAISSGVAEYEPMFGNDENPFRTPIKYSKSNVLSPDDKFLLEEPFGECFFPSPNIGYSKVKVTNTKPHDVDNTDNSSVTHTATGYVIHEFYTAKDFPVVTERTDLSSVSTPPVEHFLESLLNFYAEDMTTVSQGYMIELNDMHGKPKSEKVYAENKTEPISGVEYFYQADGNRLNNNVTIIDPTNHVSQNEIGKEVDMVMDMRDNDNHSYKVGLNGNLDAFLALILPVAIPVVLPDISVDHTEFRSAVATKVIRKYGILQETHVIRDNSFITNKNLAYDSETGELLLTSTQNEFNDPVYSFTYPAHWMYDGMGQAYKNIGYTKTFASPGGLSTFLSTWGAMNSDYFAPGDEVYFIKTLSSSIPFDFTTSTELYKDKFWVFYNTADSKYYFIDKTGQLLTNISDLFAAPGGSVVSYVEVKIVRSGRRNLQSTPIGKITMLSNPISGSSLVFNTGSNITNAVLNATGTEFTDAWKTYCCWLQYSFQGSSVNVTPTDYLMPCTVVNPYTTGLLGNWRAKQSYTYLEDRNDQNPLSTPNIRYSGSFLNFKSLWVYGSGKWQEDNSNWTWNAKVTEYSPYGIELENVNPLGVYSSALYSYKNSLASAVASNSGYNNIAFDGFEDYYYFNNPNPLPEAHWNFLNSGFSLSNLVTSVKHSGNYSLNVPSGSTISTFRTLGTASITSGYSNGNPYTLQASDCIGYFCPTSGTYIISAWVKENTSTSVFTYINPSITVEQTGSTTSTIITTNTFSPIGNIVEGWQKIEGAFTISGAQGLRVKLNAGPNNVYFDDIRIFPKDANMKTFVYNPSSQKLMAEQDENNYTTFYEYDKDGSLIRVKKETYNGIMTLKESRSHQKH